MKSLYLTKQQLLICIMIFLAAIYALVHFAINIFRIFCTLKLNKMQDYVAEYLKAFNLHLTKALGEGYVISKTKVKRNLLLAVIDYF